MKETQDLFSKQAKLYAAFRPSYPVFLYEWLLDLVPNKEAAWDCATGNGQVAVELAKLFDHVHATDISQNQLDKATAKPNINYQLMRSETTDFADQSFDLITVAQAMHWFDHAAFNQEVARVLKPNGIIAIWGYSLLRIHPEIDPLLDHYYQEIIGPYWAPERKHVDQHYANIPFPFKVIKPEQDFFIEATWTLDQFEGYLRTWSSLQAYLKDHSDDPVAVLVEEIREKELWRDRFQVRFPIFSMVGQKAV